MVLRAAPHGEAAVLSIRPKTHDPNNTSITPSIVENLSGLGMKSGLVSDDDGMWRGSARECRISLSDSY